MQTRDMNFHETREIRARKLHPIHFFHMIYVSTISYSWADFLRNVYESSLTFIFIIQSARLILQARARDSIEIYFTYN
jgi:hypothetical protein